MKTRIFAIALACAATVAAAAGDVTDSTDSTGRDAMKKHIASQLAAGKVACDGLPSLSAGLQSMCDTMRNRQEEDEVKQTCLAKKLKGPALKTCTAPIRHKYRLRDE